MPEDMATAILSSCTLTPCPQCKAPLVRVNGKVQGPLVFEGVLPGAMTVTPHLDGCLEEKP